MAHLLEHLDFIETTNGRRDQRGARLARRELERQDVGRPHQLLRDLHRDRRQPEVGARPETDRMVNVKFTEQILDTEMTVVRNEFERGENSPASVLSQRVASRRISGTTTASPRSARRNDLEKVPINRLRGVLQEVLSAGQRGAGHHGTDRRKPDAADGGRLDGEASASRPACSIGPTRWSRPRTASGSSSLRRVGQGQNVIIALHAVAAGHPDAAALRSCRA